MQVRLKNICKSYSGNLVLKNMNLNIDAGQIHSLVGENGAGKSTLMKILIGVEKADSGDILLNGQLRKWRHPMDARNAGIATVYQELSLIPSLSVFENVFLGQLIQDRLQFVNWAEMKQRAENIFKELEFPMDIEKTVEELSIAEKQMVEVGRALTQNAELIILDEPTSPLTEQDAERLFARIKILGEKGVSIIYITHRLEEVFKIADDITILRDGGFVRSCPITEIDMQTIVRDMVGRELAEQFPPRPLSSEKKNRQPALKVENATRDNEFYNVSFNVCKGEIVGIAGLVGAGRTELVEAIFGVNKLDNGLIEINGNPIRIGSPTKAVTAGIGLIPDDRKLKGLVPEAAVDFNLGMATQRKFASRLGFRFREKEAAAAQNIIERLRVILHSAKQHVSSLSGGNQQKIVIGKSLITDSSILFFDEPTRGIDVGAKREIYSLLRKLADEGAAIVLVSSELEEILGLTDRILVMHKGRLMGEFGPDEATQEKIMQMAVGINYKNGKIL
jgi:ABC-type sugar transport system ATPase subunit